MGTVPCIRLPRTSLKRPVCRKSDRKETTARIKLRALRDARARQGIPNTLKQAAQAISNRKCGHANGPAGGNRKHVNGNQFLSDKLHLKSVIIIVTIFLKVITHRVVRKKFLKKQLNEQNCRKNTLRHARLETEARQG